MNAQTPKRLVIADEADCVRFGARLGDELRAGDLVLLKGTLGMGKSVIARAALRARADDPDLEVPSPSYTLVQPYRMAGGMAVWHVDLYRVADPDECLELGLDEALDGAALLVEWPQHLSDEVRSSAAAVLLIEIAQGETPESRVITMGADKGWETRLESLTSDA